MMFEVVKNEQVIYTGTKQDCIDFAGVNSSKSQPAIVRVIKNEE